VREVSTLRYFRSTYDPATSRTVNPEVAGSSPVEPAILFREVTTHGTTALSDTKPSPLRIAHCPVPVGRSRVTTRSAGCALT
jgi:hypothetical protein